MILTILRHVPLWVFAALAALVVYGVSQAFDRRVSLQRSLVLPIVMVGLSLYGVLGAFGQQHFVLLAWADGLVAAVVLLFPRLRFSGVQYDVDTRSFSVPGSWVPLALMMSIFTLKFGVGVALGFNPALRDNAVLALGASALYGAFSGIFLTRAAVLWMLAQRTAKAVSRAA